MKSQKPWLLYFATYLSLPRHPSTAKTQDFLQNAVKIIIDPGEFIEWMCKEDRESKFDSDNLVGSIPFSKVWIEFIERKTGAPTGVGFEDLGHKLGGELCNAVGYDLGSHSLYFFREHKGKAGSFINSISYDEIGESTDTDVIHHMTVLHFISKYLQTEYVNAISNKIDLGIKRTNKKGKFKPVLSSYTTIFRKQPNQKSSPRLLLQHEVDWQFRWKVRGHWRRIKGTGKGPDGIEIEGFTWVRECIKGPENKPILNRPKVFKNQIQPGYIEIPERVAL